jgi:hypothetical protein
MKELLASEYQEGYNSGISEGYRTAQRIFLNYATNPSLIDPYSAETLKEWAEKDLEDLLDNKG